jgi:hypothetical protein
LAAERPNSESGCRASYHRSERIGGARLAYKSKAERKRELFMTLAEAINRISKQDKCSWGEAKDQIRAALADNAIGPLRWEDERPTAVSTAPIDRDFWQKADIRQDGRVFDPWGKRLRTLLVIKHMIFQLWPERSAASAGSKSGQAGPTTKGKGRGRPGAEIEIHRAIDRLLQRGSNVNNMLRKELVALVYQECGKRRKPRTIQKHISSWLEKHRTDA